jgi:hypothetical protein
MSIATVVTLRFNSRRTRNYVLLFHLRLDSLFVASYDSQGYGGGIVSRLHAGV